MPNNVDAMVGDKAGVVTNADAVVSTGAKRVPKISVMLITYNHEKYIAEALESILSQETEYDVEINVIEDCSTDRTQEVVMRYVEKFPDKVKPYFNKQNIGSKVTQRNFYRGFKTLDGDYIAILEGDDYWTSPHKLQKQISFLEANPGYVACAHNTIKVYEDKSKEPHRFLYWPGKPADSSIEDCIYLQAFFHTTTLVYRNVFKGNTPPQFASPWSCDIFILIAHAQFGKIRHFDEDMAVYRAHPGGRFSTMSTLDGWFFNIGSLRRYNAWLGYRYAKAFSGSIARYCSVVLRNAGKDGVEPLKWHQFVKYLGLRIFYRLIYLVLNSPNYLANDLPKLVRRKAKLGAKAAKRRVKAVRRKVKDVLRWIVGKPKKRKKKKRRAPGPRQRTTNSISDLTSSPGAREKAADWNRVER